MSRGDLRIIEFSTTEYGFSYVTNSQTEIQFSTSSLDTILAHATWGQSRQSFGKYYFQSDDSTPVHHFYALHDGSGSLAFDNFYDTTENLHAHTGYEKAIYWPAHNFIMFRQMDMVTWDGFGLNADSIDVAANPSNYLPEYQLEPFSTGPIMIDGDLPLDARFCNDLLVVWRENTRYGTNILSMYSWSTSHFRAEVTKTVTVNTTVTSLVSFGTSGALLWESGSKTGTLYKTDATTTSISVQINDATLASTFSSTAAASIDFRLIQARADPDNPAEDSQVYAFFTSGDLFEVTLNTGTSKIELDPVYTLDSRMNLYQPLDIGHYFIANMVEHGATYPTSDTDIYDTAAVCFHILDDSVDIDCIELTTSETILD